MSGKLEADQQQKQSLVLTKMTEAKDAHAAVIKGIRDVCKTSFRAANKKYEKKLDKIESAREDAIAAADDKYKESIKNIERWFDMGMVDDDEYEEAKKNAVNIHTKAEEVSERAREDAIYAADKKRKIAIDIAKKKFSDSSSAANKVYQELLDKILAEADAEADAIYAKS